MGRGDTVLPAVSTASNELKNGILVILPFCGRILWQNLSEPTLVPVKHQNLLLTLQRYEVFAKLPNF